MLAEISLAAHFIALFVVGGHYTGLPFVSVCVGVHGVTPSQEG